MSRTPFIAAVLFAGLMAGPAFAATLEFHADLKGASEVPAKTTAGTGEALAKLDTTTKQLTYTVTFDKLSGPATAAHFHGPAAPDANAAPVVPLPAPVVSPYHGTATLTDAQIADLQAGKWYVNVHTAANPGGEIRGQVTAGK
jgi:hypothetical protein